MHIIQSKFDNFAIFEKHIVILAIILVVKFGYLVIIFIKNFIKTLDLKLALSYIMNSNQ